MRYPFIKEYQEQFSLSALCRVMQVSRSGFYAWRQRPKSARQQQNETLTEQIRTAYHESDGKWCLVSDRQIAVFLQSVPDNARKKRLALSLEGACNQEYFTDPIMLKQAKCCPDTTPINAVLPDFDGEPILVVASRNEAN